MKSHIRLLVAGLVVMALWAITKQDALQARISEGSISKAETIFYTANGQRSSVWRTSHESPSDNVCQLLPPSYQHASALSLWTEKIDTILNASQLLPNDEAYEFRDLNAILLHLISPRLPNSVKALPRDWKPIKNVLEKVAYPRWKYMMMMQNEGNTILGEENAHAPRPVKILVMGGSVVWGINCLQIFSNKVQHSLTREQCAWPYRLQQFLDSIVGGQEKRIFEVHTVAMGGSNTVTGNSILEYDLLPSEAKHPDIIINAYATNDMHLSSLNQGEGAKPLEMGGSWREKVMAVLQDFIRLASSPIPTCNKQQQSSDISTSKKDSMSPPVIFHLDDYLGNEQKELLATTELSQAVQVLANYYGNVVAMSYPDLVRDWVYGDTQEWWFSPMGWYPTYKQDKTKMAREIHPGMPMHVIIPYIVSYNLLNLFTTYCDRHAYYHDEIKTTSMQEESNPRAKILDEEYDMARTNGNLQLPALRNNIRLPGKPKVTPGGLPPPLSPDLSLQDITALWKSYDIASVADTSKSLPCTSPNSPRCPFAWVSGLLNEHNGLEEQGVEEYFKEHSLGYYNHNWELRRHVDGKKMGYVPVGEQPGANLTIIFGTPEASSAPIRQVVLFYLKSYGDRWKDSILQVRIDRASTSEPLMFRQLVGFHAKNTSEMYLERIKLPGPRAREDPRIRLQAFFMAGQAFKIMGLLACR